MGSPEMQANLFVGNSVTASLHRRRGDIAQLIRALRWQRRGPGFESPYLHQNQTDGQIFYMLPRQIRYNRNTT